MNFLDVFGDRNHLLAREKAALFRKDLVLQVDGGHPGGFVFPHRAPHIERVAVARIRVADDRNADGVGDIPGVGHHFGHRQQAHIGEAALGGRAGPGHIHGAVAHILGNAGVQGVERKGRNHHFVRRQHPAQLGSGFHNDIASVEIESGSEAGK